MTFERTPFGDALFAKICWNHGCLDQGRGWQHARGFPERSGGLALDWVSVGRAGIGNDGIWGAPDDLPSFRYGRTDEGAYLSVSLDGASYVRRGDRRTIHLAAVLPDLVLAAATGRSLRHLIDLPGIGDEVIAQAHTTAVGGRVETCIQLEDRT